jgi:hypothetical protein
VLLLVEIIFNFIIIIGLMREHRLFGLLICCLYLNNSVLCNTANTGNTENMYLVDLSYSKQQEEPRVL